MTRAFAIAMYVLPIIMVVAGAALVVAAAWGVDHRLGLLVAGVALIAFNVDVPGARRRARRSDLK